MYTFSSKLKKTAFILMLLGFLGVVYGFLAAPSSIEEAKAMVSNHDAHHDQNGHNQTGSHNDSHAHEEEIGHDNSQTHHQQDGNHDNHAHEEKIGHDNSQGHHQQEGHNDSHAHEEKMGHDNSQGHHQQDGNHYSHAHEEEMGHDNSQGHHQQEGHNDSHAHDDHAAHDLHVFHQLKNRPWSALYVAAFFFMMISLGTLSFYAIQRAAQAGWSPLLFRVMEGITGYLLPGLVIVLILLILSGMHLNHLFIWMDPEVVAKDKIIQGKTAYMNVPFFLIRAFIYSLGWILYRHFSRKWSLAQDISDDNSNFKRNFRFSAAFLVFFLFTESMMSWDWIMSVDPHWFSTLFGWYVYSSMLVSSVTVIAMITIYLKSKGYLEKVNDSHIHDLAKFMFGLSIFWTYLWFSQFMLYWFSNIPEETVYFVTRIQDYSLPFWGMIVMNFIFPLLVLMNSDFKRVNWFVIMSGIVILMGHYLDIFNMIMPSTVGDKWFIGIPEISSVLLFTGLFIYVVFSSLTKAPLVAKRNPFIKESEHFHY